MALDPCSRLLKYCLFLFNLLFFLSGTVLIVIGVWITDDDYKPQVFSWMDTSFILSLTYAIISIGCIMVLFGFLGCCGATTENRCLLGLFATLLFFLLVAEIGIVTLAFVSRDQVDAFVESQMETAIEEEYEGEEGSNSASVAVNLIQLLFKCCGANGYEDWRESLWYESGRSWMTLKEEEIQRKYPATCCKWDFDNDDMAEKLLNSIFIDPNQDDEYTLVQCNLPSPNDFMYSSGCSASLKFFFRQHANIIGGVAAGVVGIEVIMILLTIIVMKLTKSSS